MKTNIKILSSILLCSSFLTIAPLMAERNFTQEEKVEVKKKASFKKIQLALLLDTSNSMDGLINQAKNQLWETIAHLSKQAPEAEIEIALYHYGNDNLSVYNDYVDQVLNFTNNLDKVSSALFKLRTEGGSEYCGSVIEKASSALFWDDNKSTQRVLVIAGNESFAQGNTSYATAIACAVKKNIQVNTIFCGNNSTGKNMKWQEGAILGNGNYFSISHNDDVQQIATPYDDKILTCNTKINKTYVPIYSNQNVSKMEMELNDEEQGYEQKERLVEKALVKKNKAVYKKDSWDAVDNYISNSGSVSKMKEASSGVLNSRFAGKNDEEIKEEVLKLKKERDTLHTELEELEKKRTAYILNNSSDSKDKNTLGKQLVNTILK